MTRLATYGVLAVAVATVVNAIVRVVAVSLLGVSAEFEPLGWGPVVNTTVVAVVGATVVYGLLTYVSTTPIRTFRIIAAVVLVVSFVPLLVPPPFLAGAPWSVLVTLAAMHVTTAVVVIGILPRATGSGVSTR